MSRPPRPSPAEQAEVSATAAIIAGLRKRLASVYFLEHPLILGELRKLEVQLNEQMSDGAGRHAANVTVPLEDVSGFDLKPDPLAAATAAEFMAAVRQYRAWSGNPSLRKMAERAGQAVVHSTIHSALRGDNLPKLEVVKAIIIGCGGSQDDMRAFVTAWRCLDSGRGPASVTAAGPAPDLTLVRG